VVVDTMICLTRLFREETGEYMHVLELNMSYVCLIIIYKKNL